MKLSTKSRYGLRILIQIALDNINGRKLSHGRSIAEEQNITEPYLEQIMHPLKMAGMVSTVRGCKGGYELRKPPEEISVLDIVELFEGPVNFAECIKGDRHCGRLQNCPVSFVWSELNTVFRNTAEDITLDTILRKYQEKTDNSYVI